MTQNHRDILTARMLREAHLECGRVDYADAIVQISAEQPELMALALRCAHRSFANTEDRELLAVEGWGLFLDAVAAYVEPSVNRIPAAEAACDEERTAEDERLDAPEHGQAGPINQGYD